MPVTPYMNLTLPTVSVTLGPLYASQNNEAITNIDSHNHTSGQGVSVPTDGLNINADLTFGNYNATSLRTTRYTAQGGALALVTDRGCLYVAGVDLYYNDGNGNQIQLTAGGALNAASIGGIGGDYTTSTASVFYTNSSKTFTFWSDTNTSALVDVGSILLRRVDIASSAAITLKPSTSLTVGYTLTLPSALPAATSYVLSDSSGNISFTSGIPATTVMLFFQAAAPTGWTRVTTQNDKFIRVVSAGSPGTAGGVNAASTDLRHSHTGPSHTHTTPNHNHSLGSDAWARLAYDATNDQLACDHVTGKTSWAGDRYLDGNVVASTPAGSPFTVAVALDGDTDTDGSGTTGASGTGATSSTFTSGSFAYIDVLIASKD